MLRNDPVPSILEMRRQAPERRDGLVKVTRMSVVLLGGWTKKLLLLPLLEKRTELLQMPLYGDLKKIFIEIEFIHHSMSLLREKL